MDLVEFLTARLDEDEQTARTAAKATDRDWLPWTEGSGRGERAFVSGDGEPVAECDGYPPSAVAAHIARHDPARVLVDVTAKRIILAEHGRGEFNDCRRCAPWETAPPYESPGTVDFPCRTLRALAMPYADHPDYREEWKP